MSATSDLQAIDEWWRDFDRRHPDLRRPKTFFHYLVMARYLYHPRHKVNLDLWKRDELGWRREVIIGNSSAYDSDTKERFVDAHPDAWPVPTGELARAYVQQLFEWNRPTSDCMERDRIPYRKVSKERAMFGTAHAPVIFRQPVKAANLAYVDLEKAYWNIFRHVSYDVSYERGEYTAIGRMWFRGDRGLLHPTVTVSLPRFKVNEDGTRGRIQGINQPLTIRRPHLYKAIIGIARSTTHQVARYGHENTERGHSHLFAPELCNLIDDTLLAVAHDLDRRFQVFSVNSDGYIVRGEDAEAVIAHLRDNWRLPAKVKHRGAGVVRGVGSWKIGRAEANDENTWSEEPVYNLPNWRHHEWEWIRKNRLLLTREEPIRLGARIQAALEEGRAMRKAWEEAQSESA